MHETQKNTNNHYELLNYLYSYFINMNKHQQYKHYINTFGLPEGEMQEWHKSDYNPTWTVQCYCSSIYRHSTQPEQNYIHVPDIYS